jgi:hypothetical protein
VRISRWILAVGGLIFSLMLAFFLRQPVHDFLVVPLAYTAWLLSSLYASVPQLILWSVLLLLACVGILSQLLPEPGPSSRASRRRPPQLGQVESLAIWILRARTSNYFKWQLANRLGRIAHKLAAPPATLTGQNSRPTAVAAYLSAGVEHSFVDFPAPRHRWQRPRVTPLDLDPVEAVEALESQMEIGHGRHGRGI